MSDELVTNAREKLARQLLRRERAHVIRGASADAVAGDVAAAIATAEVRIYCTPAGPVPESSWVFTRWLDVAPARLEALLEELGAIARTYTEDGRDVPCLWSPVWSGVCSGGLTTMWEVDSL